MKTEGVVITEHKGKLGMLLVVDVLKVSCCVD